MEALSHRIRIDFDHRVFFTRAVAEAANPTLDEALGSTERVLAVVEQAVDAAHPGWGGKLAARLGHRLVSERARVLPGGEECKNDDRLWRKIMHWIEACGLDRHNALLAVGGGAFLDAVGFAAATAHRGVRLVRVPTTVLSQADS